MKKLLAGLFLGGFVFLLSCEGPQGPPGVPGQDGIYIVGEVYEVGNVNFTAQNNYSSGLVEIPPIEESDKIIAFILWELDNGEDVWRALPQTVFASPGVFQYNYDFTRSNFTLFMDGNFDLSQLPNEFLLDQVFRLVVIPADFAANARVDLTDYDVVMKLIGADEEDVIKLQPKK